MIEERKHLRKKSKIYCHLRCGVFRNGQPECGDDRRIYVVTTSTLEQRSLVLVAFVSAAELCPENHCNAHML